MTEFEGSAEAGRGSAEADEVSTPGEVATGADGPTPAATETASVAQPGGDSDVAASPVAEALAELDTLPQRELGEHPEVYQRIHAELQSALATIDNA